MHGQPHGCVNAGTRQPGPSARWSASPPHALHHVSVLGGTALVAGSGGTTLFGALGLVLSIPMLFRLHRRFGNWTAPAIGRTVFIVMFALSTWVVGPAISGSSDLNSPVPTTDHSSHH